MHPSPFVKAISQAFVHISSRYFGRLAGVLLLITLVLSTLGFFMTILVSALAIIFTVVGLIAVQSFIMPWWIPLAGVLWLPLAFEIFEYVEGDRWFTMWEAIGEFFE